MYSVADDALLQPSAAQQAAAADGARRLAPLGTAPRSRAARRWAGERCANEDRAEGAAMGTLAGVPDRASRGGDAAISEHIKMKRASLSIACACRVEGTGVSGCSIFWRRERRSFCHHTRSGLVVPEDPWASQVTAWHVGL